VLQLDATSSAVPLLEPSTHDTPFAAAIHITRQRLSSNGSLPPSPGSSSSRSSEQHQARPSSSSNNTHTTTSSSSSSGDDAFVELHYVLSGSGVCQAPSGQRHTLLPGDCILSTAGALQLAASSSTSSSTPQTQHEEAHHQQQQQVRSQPGPLAAAAAVRFPDLTAFLRRALPRKAQQQQQQQQQQQVAVQQPEEQEPLVTLQLLVPASVLTGDTPVTSPAHQAALAAALPWRGVAPGATLTPAAACELLSASLPLLQHQEEDAAPHSSTSSGGSTSSSSMQPLYHHVSPEQVVGPLHSSGPARSHHHLPSQQGLVHTTTTTSSSSSAEVGTATATAAAAAPLPPLLLGVPTSPTKRALTEVACWQLPAQSNRLALLFGPHAAPAVSLSFGLEIFEPGHVTPRHVHPGAYELFFVVAGEGLGVVRHTDDSNPSHTSSSSSRNGTSDVTSSSSDGTGGSSSSGRWREEHLVLAPGDVAVFPPGVVHALDNPHPGRLYCLQVSGGRPGAA
jgi:quercetin dioxygenase-like cupin family protein